MHSVVDIECSSQGQNNKLDIHSKDHHDECQEIVTENYREGIGSYFHDPIDHVQRAGKRNCGDID